MSDTATIIGLIMGVVSFVAGGVVWYKGAVEKRYAAERSFEHLRRNQEQMAQSLAAVMRSVDDQSHDQDDAIGLLNDIRRDLLELNRTHVETKALTMAICNRLEGLAARVDGSTSGWSRRNEG